MDKLIGEAESLLSGMIDHQRGKLVKRAREVMPECTFEDVMNPDGVEPLRRDPSFNYEDGILAGLIAAQIAMRARVFLPHSRGESGSAPLPPIHD
jgi:hypothetical protein